VIVRIDAKDDRTDLLVRSEAAKHHHALIQVVTWVVLVHCVAAVLVLQRLGTPLSGLIAPATIPSSISSRAGGNNPPNLGYTAVWRAVWRATRPTRPCAGGGPTERTRRVQPDRFSACQVR